MTRETILLLDREPELASVLATCLERPVKLCSSPEAFLESLAGNVALAIAEPTFRDPSDGLECLALARKRGIHTIVWSGKEVDSCLAQCRASGLSMLLAKTAPLLVEEVSLALSFMERGIQPGLGKYLEPHHKILGRDEVSNLHQVGKVCRHVQSELDGPLSTSRKLRLVLDELLSNALHHSARDLAHLEWGADAHKHVFLVRDDAGSLQPDEALRLLDRHLRGEGLMDPRGRGLHLSRIHADRIYATVVPSRMTELAAIFWHSPGFYQGPKPVWFLETHLSKEP